MASPLWAQVPVPNTLVNGTAIDATALNTNFITIANRALDRLSGGHLAGNITADSLVTIDGVDVGVQACTTCTPTFAGATVTGPVAVNTITEVFSLPAIVSNVLTLDVTASDNYIVTFNADITTLTFTNLFASDRHGKIELLLVANGTPHTVSWPASVKWPGASAPTITSTNGKVDIFECRTYSAGVIWYCKVIGQNY